MGQAPSANLMQFDVGRHIEETKLESYIMGSLAEEAATEVEQHLLLCEACRSRATQAESYIRAMKRAAQALPTAGVRKRWILGILFPAFVVGALMLTASVLRVAPFGHDRSPAAIALFAIRGADTEAYGPSRRALLLRPDLSGLPAAPAYRLAVVGSSGSLVWQGMVSGLAQPPGAIIPPQRAGVYFVRVSLPSGELLRQYGLKLRGSD